MLFTRDEGDDLATLGEQALSAGCDLICAIEKSIRELKDQESKGKTCERYEGARAMCFDAILTYMGPKDGGYKYENPILHAYSG